MYTITDEKVQGQPVLRLSGGGQSMAIAPVQGANWFSWTVDGMEHFAPWDLLVEGTKYGTPVLFPTPNRVYNGRYVWQGRVMEQRKRGKNRVIHGLMYDEPFAEVNRRQDEDACSVTLTATITQGEMLESYPFPCRLTLTFTLSGQGPRVEYRVENLGEEPMPFGFALHPYFAKMDAPEDCFVQMPAPFVHEADENKIPSGRVFPVEGTYYDLRQPRSIADAVLDHVYQGIREGDRAWLIWRRSGRAVSLTASEEFDHMVVFTPTDRPCVCLENQTCSTDAINRYAAGFEATAHLLVLKPGGSQGGWIAFSAGRWPSPDAPILGEHG